MRSPKDLLAVWLKVPPTTVPVALLKTAPAYQPRSEAPLAVRDRSRWDDESMAHVALLRSRLADSTSRDLEPLLVADLGEGLFVVDGHHRLRAYRLAKRGQIPVRVLKVPSMDAVMVSKLVNFGSEKLPMKREQAAEACWQFIAYVTLQGRTAVPSTRSLESRFGVSRATTGRMCKRITEVKRADYSLAACDPGTGWPLWKHVRGNASRHLVDTLPIEQLLLHRAEKLAKAMAGLMDKYDPPVVAMALGMLKADALDPERRDAIEEVRQAALAEDSADPFPDF